ncbi:MAG: Hint domain-containing protein [Pseudomonadota bacterium]
MPNTIFEEDFENETVAGKTNSLGDFEITDGRGVTVTTGRDGPNKVSDFFTISNSNDALSGDYDYKGADGKFLASNDLDSVDGVNADGTRTLEATGIDISGHKNLEFSVDLAQTEWRFSPQTKITDSWEANTSFTVEVSIDGGPYEQIFGVEEGSNSGQPRVDNNLDGFGEGSPISDRFTTYKADINGTGETLDLRISHNNSTDKFEDIAIDNIQITGVEGNDNTLCLTRGVLVMTEHGARPVEDLEVGDLVLTRDTGLQPVRWIGSRTLSGHNLAAKPDLRPIRIAAGALGDALPTRDLLVSPHHRMMIGGWRAQVLFSLPEALVAAKDLVNDQSVRVDAAPDGVDYFHVMFDQHAIIYAEGAETESFYPHSDALTAVDKAALDELLAIFPELAEESTGMRPVAPQVTTTEAKALLLI